MLMAVVAPAASAASPESELLTLMNAERSASGLAPLATHPDLTDDALIWSQHLMSQGSLSHNPNLSSVTTGWDKLGENVGVGTSAAALHSAFMSSTSHRGNIMGDYSYVGIAVVEEKATKLWVTVVFMDPIGQQQDPGPTTEPVPYAESQPSPAPAPEAPVAATQSTRPTPAPAAPAAPVVAFVRTRAQPIVD
jgi:hypothetical protein